MGRAWLAAGAPPAKHGAICFAVAVCIYANSLQGEFVFDDHEAIENNIDVRMDTPLQSVFSNDFWGQPMSSPESHKSYRPLTVLTFRWNRQLHGMDPLGFHAVNVLLHGLVSVLFLVVLWRVGVSQMISVITALLFATHPIHTEAVANIAGRSEMLSASFFLAAILAYHKGLDSSFHYHVPSSQYQWKPYIWLATCITLSAGAMLCKEQGITCLGVCAVHDMFTVGGIRFLQDKRRGVRQEVCLRLVVLVAAIVVTLVVRIVVLGGRGNPNFIDSDNPTSFCPEYSTRLMTYLYLCAFNFWLLLCPSSLCFDWSMGSIPLVRSMVDPRNIFSSFFFLLVMLLSLKALWSLPVVMAMGRIRSPSNVNYLPQGQELNDAHLLTFALSLLVLPFLPASNLFFPVGFVVAERVLYIPSMGFCLLVAMGMGRVVGIPLDKRRQLSSSSHSKNATSSPAPSREVTKPRSVVMTLFVCYLLAVFGSKTVTRNNNWQNMFQLVSDALGTNPGNAKVHFTMGNVLTQQGNRTCELYYRQAIALRPNYTLAWTNLGLILLNTERADEAERCYNQALAIQPDHITANTNLAHLCRIQGRWEQALKHYRLASRRRPRDPSLHYYAAQMLNKQGQVEDAVKTLRMALNLHDNYAEAHLLLGNILAHSQNKSVLSQALAHLEKAVQLRPQDAMGHLDLGKLLAHRKHWNAATDHLLQAVSLDPDLSEARDLLHHIQATNLRKTN